MFKTNKKTLISGMAAVVVAFGALGGAAAYASSSSAKHAALQQSGIDAARAVQSAVAKVAGLPAKVSFKHKLGGSYYEVDVFHNGITHEVKVDAQNGQVIGSKVEHDDDDIVPQTAVSLQQAMSAVLKKTGGKVKEAELKAKHGMAHYQVETVSGSREYDTVIDAQSGAVLHSAPDHD